MGNPRCYAWATFIAKLVAMETDLSFCLTLMIARLVARLVTMETHLEFLVDLDGC